MDKKKIERINELARKAKTQGLTAAETEERAGLRKEYIASFRNNMRATLDSIVIQESDGTLTPLKKKEPHQVHPHEHCGCGCHDHHHEHHHERHDGHCGCRHHHDDSTLNH